MEDHSSAHSSFPNHFQQRHHSLNLPSLQSPSMEYPTGQPLPDGLGLGSGPEQAAASFPPSSTHFGRGSESNGVERGYQSMAEDCVAVDGGLGDPLDGESGLGWHYATTWYGGSEKEQVWDEGGNCKHAVGDFHSDCRSSTDDVFYGRDSVENFSAVCRSAKDKANYNSHANVSPDETRDGPLYSAVAGDSYYARQNSIYGRDNIANSFSDSSVEDCKSDSHAFRSHGYLGGEEDLGSSQSPAGDRPHRASTSAEFTAGPWISHPVSRHVSEREDGQWRGGTDAQILVSAYQTPKSAAGVDSGAYTQKLDSFSEAFLCYRKRGFPVVARGPSAGRTWKVEAGKGECAGSAKPSRSCVFGSVSDSYDAPCSSSSPPPALPSPNPPSHYMPSVLSPPPTPLPPPSLSPSQMESLFSGVGPSTLDGGESLAAVQFFPSNLQPLAPFHPSGMIWKLPVVSQCLPQHPGDSRSVAEDNFRSSHCSDYGSVTAHHGLQTPEVSFLPSSSQRPSLHSSRPLCGSNRSSIHHPLRLPPHQSHLPSLHYKTEERQRPYVDSQEVMTQTFGQTHQKNGGPPNSTQTPFPSMLQSYRGRRGHYTAPPILNPLRSGTGLYSCVSSLHQKAKEVTTGGVREDGCCVLPCVNVGPDFQAEIPPCPLKWEDSDEESPKEQLLWKPWAGLAEGANIQEQVERLLTMCSSSCLPGGGSNTELALHCLYYCQGDIMATLEMLLFSQPSPSGDYHYSGSDVWSDSEKRLFKSALATYSRDFSLIQKMVRTKSVFQCVEFYYLSNRLQDKQRKHKEEEEEHCGVQQIRVPPINQRMNAPFGLERALPVPPLASFFPCKLCGKMFYKIKSRNAHMKIHRQTQEDWGDRRLQHQLLTQHLALNLSQNITPGLGSNLLQPQASAPAYATTGLAQTSSNSNSSVSPVDSVVSFTDGSKRCAARRDSSVLNNSGEATFSNGSLANPYAVNTSDTSDPGDSQGGPAPIVTLHQSWSSFGHSPNSMQFYGGPEGKEAGGNITGAAGSVNWL